MAEQLRRTERQTDKQREGGRERGRERGTINTRQYGWAFAPTEDEGVTILRTRV